MRSKDILYVYTEKYQKKEKALTDQSIISYIFRRCCSTIIF